MKTNNREILVLYNPDSPAHKRTVAHAQSLSEHVKSYPFEKASATNMDWRSIIDMLGIDPKELLDKSTEQYQENIRGKEFDAEGWLNVIMHNLDIIRAPIAIRGKEAVQCERPTDIHKLMDTSMFSDNHSLRTERP